MDAVGTLSSGTSPIPHVGAAFPLRLGARVIDLIVHYVAYIAGVFGAGIVIGIFAALAGTPVSDYTSKLQHAGVVNYLIALLGSVLYHTLCEGLHGATLGKRLLKIHVMKVDGTPCSLIPAFIRSLGFYVDGLFFGAVAAFKMRSSDLQQRYGDRWANTVVVERARLPGYSWPSGRRFAAVLLGAMAVDGLFGGLSTLLQALL